MSKTIVITRPRGDEADLAEALQEMGARVICEPLMDIILQHDRRQALEHALKREPDAVILTSRHGARALAALTELRDPMLLCVGEATALVAQSLGFSRIAVCGGTSDKLASYIAAAYDDGTHFLYASGEEVRVDIGMALAEHTMKVERIALYEAVAVSQLSDILTAHLNRRQIDAITFLSPRTARIFSALLAKAGLGKETAQLEAFALSHTVAEALAGAPWRRVHVADKATLASLIRSVDNMLHERDAP
ncbi:MAG: uroporphyrinogen-III synthase [Pseudomonadota bacterium]|nr:uroporphyrinogen-III synthase [Pseudomonadota bacterium]MDE3037048.1 uroporphyrinogen-III synthase [Pseudomonadota bacterium]